MKNSQNQSKALWHLAFTSVITAITFTSTIYLCISKDCYSQAVFFSVAFAMAEFFIYQMVKNSNN